MYANNTPVSYQDDYWTNNPPVYRNYTIDGKVYQVWNEELKFEGFYCYNNQTVVVSKETTKCLSDNYFVWGLSSVMVYIMLSLQIAWM